MTGILSFNHDDLFLRKLLLFLLGDVQAQHAMLQLCADVRFGERIPHIETPLHRTSSALLTDDLNGKENLRYTTFTILIIMCKKQ